MSEPLAFVSGARGGIGAVIVQRLLADGYAVVPWSRQTGAIGELPHERLLWSPDFDVRQSLADWHSHVSADIETYGTPDVLVIAHGARPCVKPTVALTEADIEAVWRTDVWGTFAACQTVGAAMLAQRHGSIVIVSSIHGTVTYPQRAVYAMCKSALGGLVRSLALEWGPSGVTINAVCPWQVAGRRTECFIAQAATQGEDLREAYLGRTPTRKLITPDEVADAALFLARNKACNGLELLLDGGVSKSMWFKPFTEPALNA